MITRFGQATKKAPSHTSGRGAKCTPRYHPNFRLKANTLIGDNGALPYRVTSACVSPICSKAKCTTRRLCATLSHVTLSVKIRTQVSELYHRILYDIISHFFCFCKRFLKKIKQISYNN